jgi:hypothetical protein
MNHVARERKPSDGIVVCYGQPAYRSVPGESRTAQRQDANAKTSNRTEPERDPTDRYQPECAACECDSPDSYPAAREEHSEREIANGEPAFRYAAPVPPVYHRASGDVHERQA